MNLVYGGLSLIALGVFVILLAVAILAGLSIFRRRKPSSKEDFKAMGWLHNRHVQHDEEKK